MMDEIEERRAKAYADLERVVDELMACARLEDGETEAEMATAYCLVVGTELFETADGSGAVGLFPRQGSQAYWKSIGLLQAALFKYAEK